MTKQRFCNECGRPIADNEPATATPGYNKWEGSGVTFVPPTLICDMCQPEIIPAFMLEQQLYPGHWVPKFAFHAEDRDAASGKAEGWARYHSMSVFDVRIRDANENEAANWLHDEYV